MLSRIIGTVGILLLLAIALALPVIPGMQRGSEAALRSDVAGAVGRVGERLPDVTLQDLDGAPVRLSNFRGKRVLLTFERSVDW
jgi:cytochrome oxidase Cu insertion factor (SCO1/SenC/PrrC family)